MADKEDIIEQLIRYADDEMSTAEKAEMKNLLRNDESLQERYENILLAKNAVRFNGLSNKINTIHNDYLKNRTTDLSTQNLQKPKLVNFARYALKAAAIFILAAGCYWIYLYSSTTNNSFYNENYLAYNLPVTRGNDLSSDEIDSLYREKNFSALLNAYATKKAKTIQDSFLAAVVYLENNNAEEAVRLFKSIQAANANSHQQNFEQQTDYYLLLAEIRANKIEEAEQQLKIILSNPDHMYFEKAKELSKTKLKILGWKK